MCAYPRNADVCNVILGIIPYSFLLLLPIASHMTKRSMCSSLANHLVKIVLNSQLELVVVALKVPFK